MKTGELSVDQVKSVLYATLNVMEEKYEKEFPTIYGYQKFFLCDAIENHAERIQHELKMSQSTHAIIHNPTAWQLVKMWFFGG